MASKYVKIARGKYVRNVLRRREYGRGGVEVAAQTVGVEEAIRKRTQFRKYNVRCPQCTLQLGRVVTLWNRTKFREHLLEHRIQKALGEERAWMEAHVVATGRWVEHRA